MCIDSWLNQSGEDHVCIAGLSQLGRASPSSFWHFMRGFFIEAEGCRVAVSHHATLSDSAWRFDLVNFAD